MVQKMAWRRPGDKPLSEPMLVILLTHICVTRSQWVNILVQSHNGWHFAHKPFKLIPSYGNVYSLIHGSNQQRISVVSDKDSRPTRLQAIIWTNEGQVYWLLYVHRKVNYSTATVSEYWLYSFLQKVSMGVSVFLSPTRRYTITLAYC